jgi:hypothetical protein
MVHLAVNGLAAGPAGLPVLGLLGVGLGSALVAWATGIAVPQRNRGRQQADPVP